MSLKRTTDRNLLRTLSVIKPEKTPQVIDTTQYRSFIRTKEPKLWEKAGARKALRLFHQTAKEVPAYGDFLRRHGVRPNSIRTTADFAHVPPTTKENYIEPYALKERSWGGTLNSHTIFAASSGTGGVPTLWPRGEAQEREAAFLHDFLLTDLFAIERARSLVIIGFPMGIYVSGMATAVPTITSLFRHAGCAVAAVGNNKENFLTVVKTAQKEFEQFILIGHPFFIKDVIETGQREGIAWTKTRVRTLFCSEGFSEDWRSYLAGQIRGSSPMDFFNTYGSSEFLLVGFENPHTIAVRQLASADHRIMTTLFGTTVPNLFQYNPLMRFIETNGPDLLITAHSGVPLIRFNQHDAGRIIPFDAMDNALDPAAEKKLAATLKRASWKPWRLPFVTLSNRSDRTLKFYAANIYPEHIMHALNHKLFFKVLTGKFVMEKKNLKNMDEYLDLHIEMRQGVKPNRALARTIQTHVVKTLERINMEYAFLRTHLAKDIVPHIDLRPYQDPTHFKAGLKPRYINR